MGKLGGLVLALASLGAAAWLAYSLLTSGLPPVDDLSTRVHGRLANRNAPYTHLDQIPETVQQSTIVVEDANFTSNTGIDPRGALRAVVDDIVRRCLCEGGSTITQQLAKQVYLEGNDAGPQRKLDTIALAIEIDRAYSKADILEFYLNTAYWRQPLSKVSLAQAAMLAGLPQAPSDYDPLAHPQAARERRGQVLVRLRDFGLITEAQLQLASVQPVASGPPSGAGTIDRNHSS